MQNPDGFRRQIEIARFDGTDIGFSGQQLVVRLLLQAFRIDCGRNPGLIGRLGEPRFDKTVERRAAFAAAGKRR
ncbi:hypothetical protein C8024_18935 [Sphingopyxis sp. BSNA05]|nr:hypothetical protein [Sphingopyxis sp. BSNA05]